jgi:16S rRNA (guanine527-N7)-methyltransferase
MLENKLDLLIEGANRLKIHLNDDQLRQFQLYFDELVVWNKRFNLTAITDYAGVQIKHFLDSLTVALAFPTLVPGSYKIIDVGAGAGFPGIPLKVAFPQIELTLLEATGKKAEFLKHMASKLDLTFDVVNARAEEAAHLSQYRERFDVAVARGLAAMATLSELTLPFLKIGGGLIAQKKGEISDELKLSTRAVEVLGGELEKILAIDLPEFTDSRCLLVIRKVKSTPQSYPRRNGLPAKKPIT